MEGIGSRDFDRARGTAAKASSLATAIDCLARGQTAGALAAAGEACLIEPARPEAHYVYGQAWMAMNAPAKAEEDTGAGAGPSRPAARPELRPLP